MATTISVRDAINYYTALGLNANKLGRALALRILADGAQRVLANLNNDLVHRRTGALMRYVGTALKSRYEGDRSVTVGLPSGQFGAMVGRVQETGQIIRPKKGKALAVPLEPARTMAGAQRDFFGPDNEHVFSLRGAFAPGGSPFFAPKGKGVLGISRGEGKNRRFEAWFAFKAEVYVKPTGWWSRGWQEAGQQRARLAREVMPAYLRGEEPR